METSIQPGIENVLQRCVEEKDTAFTIGSGSLKVLATPILIALAEQTCADSVQPFLSEGSSTVGTLVNIRHTAATPIGMNYHCKSTLTEVSERKFVFRVEMYDELGLIGDGIHERCVIQEKRFMEKANAKTTKQAILPLIRKYIDPENTIKVLEYGCKTLPLADEISAEVPFFSVSDPDESALEKYSMRNNKISAIPYHMLSDDCYFGRFRLVYSCLTFGSIAKIDNEILTLRKLIIKGGRLLIVESAKENLSSEKLEKHFSRCGFSQIETVYNDEFFAVSGVK